MKPRIHWVSPLPPAQTAIAHYTRRILPELADAADLILWTDAPEWDRELYNFCPVRRLDPDHIMPRDFARAGRRGDAQGEQPEVIFVHIGNSWPFHAGFLRLIQRIPSVVVLHDMAIQELCFQAMERGLFPRETYEADMARWHGKAGLQAAQDVFAGRRDAGDLARDIPGFEITLPRAVSVLTHTSVACDAITATDTVPSYLLDLPFRPSAKKPEVIRSGLGPLRLVQFGYTGPNRRLQKVLEALAPLKDEVDFHLDVIGNVWDPDYIQRRIDELGLSRNVRLNGFVEENELDRKLRAAHLIFNLCYPTMGEASDSQLRIWNAAAPSVVTNVGWYATLPENTVFKIAQDEEITAIQALVRRIHADPAMGRVVGAAGRAHLEERHTSARYVKTVMEVAVSVGRNTAAIYQEVEERDVLHDRLMDEQQKLMHERHRSSTLERQVRSSKRPFFEKFLFRDTGRPIRAVRRTLFHTNGKPRGIFRRIVLQDNGRPRRAFHEWMASPAYQALPRAITIYQQSSTSPRTRYFLDRLGRNSAVDGSQ